MRKNGRRTSLAIVAIVAVFTLTACALCACSSSKTAAVMRLIRADGDVLLESADGKTVGVTLNARLTDGQKLRTGDDSVATVSMDDKKIASLDEKSAAEFRASGRSLEITVTEGQVFFDVMEKLNDDELFDIKTSTMVVGIRGTSGLVGIDAEGRDCLYLTDGTVSVSINGSDSKETVKSGEALTVEMENGVPKIEKEKYDPGKLPDFAKKMIREAMGDEKLADRILTANGWDAGDIGVKTVKADEPTEKPTEPSTEPAPESEKGTEPATESEKATEPATEKPTEPETEGPTEPETEKPTEPETEKPTEPEPTAPAESETDKNTHIHDSSTLVYRAGVAATCTAPGEASRYVCSVCGAVFADADGKTPLATVTVAALGHSASKIQGKAATCDKAGTKDVWNCSRCGASFADSACTTPAGDPAIPAKGHAWDAGKITTAPTCTAAGEKVYTCKNDPSHVKKERLPATGHNWDGGKVVTPASCTAPGETVYTCKNDPSHVEKKQIPATGHSLKEVVGTPPTCDKPGTASYYLCSGCGKTFSDPSATREVNVNYLSVPATGHDLEYVPAGAESNVIEFWFCMKCGTASSDENLTRVLTPQEIFGGGN